MAPPELGGRNDMARIDGDLSKPVIINRTAKLVRVPRKLATGLLPAQFIVRDHTCQDLVFRVKDCATRLIG